MNARFIEGPYDGKFIDHETINRCCRLHPINAVPPRLFVLMPSIQFWGDIVSGIRGKNDDAGLLWPYERFFVEGGVEFHEASTNGRYEAALRGEHPDPYDVFPSHEALLAYKLQCKTAFVLSKTLDDIVPSGSLGAGMSLSHDCKTNGQFNEESNEIVIQGTITIRLRRDTDEQS